MLIILGLLHHVHVGNVADISQVHAALTVKVGAACTSEMLASSPTATLCNSQRTEMSVINHSESLKSVTIL
jgi:hypothetical protein